MSVSPSERRRITKQYVAAIHSFGQIVIKNRLLRDHLLVDGVDYWAASPLRESSPWHSPVFARLNQIQGKTIVQQQSASLVNRSASTILRTGLYWCANTFSSLTNRARSMKGDVVFVTFMPESAVAVSDQALVARYYGQLVEHVKTIGLTPVVVFLPTDSRPAAMSKGEKKTWKSLEKTLNCSTITSFITPRVVWQALMNWYKLRQNSPSCIEVAAASCAIEGLASLWPLVEDDYSNSFQGTASARTALLAAGWHHVLSKIEGAQLVVYPFEGQGWESLVEAACQHQGVAAVGYLHTIMKPWDTRAHTALRESPPRTLAIHGDHDRAELDLSQTTTEPVEALRYGYLAAERRGTSTVTSHHQVLIVMGADCANSAQHLATFCDAVSRASRQWSLVVKPHPQCGLDRSETQIRITHGSLQDALAECTAVFLCGTAAPLDSYLYGLPTAALTDESGYSMNPLDPDESFFVGDTADAVVAWLETAMQRSYPQPDASHYFDLSPGLSKWGAVIRKHVVVKS